MLALTDIYAARRRIQGHVLRTPLVRAERLSTLYGGDIRLKLECLQPTGAFKLRGASNAILNLDEKSRVRGVVTLSTGNHGRAVTHAAVANHVKARVYMSNLVPANKVDAVQALGGEVVIAGNSQDEAEAEAMRYAQERGSVAISPFDHPDVVAGQGTIGLELLEDWPEVDTVIVPVSGGGLIGGIALTLKSIDPAIHVIGVSMENGAAMHASLEAGVPVAVEEFVSYADSLGGGIGMDNQLTFSLCRDYVDELVLVDEASIARAMVALMGEEHLIVEGASAVCLAAVASDRLDVRGANTVMIMSGRNVSLDTLQAALAGRLLEEN